MIFLTLPRGNKAKGTAAILIAAIKALIVYFALHKKEERVNYYEILGDLLSAGVSVSQRSEYYSVIAAAVWRGPSGRRNTLESSTLCFEGTIWA